MAFLSLLFAAPAWAQADVFTVGGVPIDATAGTAAQAREQAIASGAPRALRRLMEQLTLPEDHGRLPSVSAAQATALASGFEVDNELRGANRYRGDLTVSFDPNGVRRLLRNSGVPFVESSAPPTLVAPVYLVNGQARLWDNNPWAGGWEEGRYVNGFAPIVRPSGFGSQVSLISPDAVARGDADALRALAAAHGVSRVLLAVAEPQGDTLTVRLSLARMGQEFDANAAGGRSGSAAGAPEITSLGTVSVRAGEANRPFVLAADRAQAALANEWKQRTVIRSQTSTELRLTALYGSVAEWRRLRSALGASPFVTDMRLDAMSRDGAYLALTYRGLREQLVSDLQRRGVNLGSDPRIGDTVSMGGGARRQGAQAPAVSTQRTNFALAPKTASPSNDLRAGMSADAILRAVTGE